MQFRDVKAEDFPTLPDQGGFKLMPSFPRSAKSCSTAIAFQLFEGKLASILCMTREEAVRHAEDWIAAWNARDLSRILSFYADDVVFEAETVVKRWGKFDGRLRGVHELKEHFALGLELAPSLRFRLIQVFFAPSGYAVLYERENGNRVIDCVTTNDDGKAVMVKAYYASLQR